VDAAVAAASAAGLRVDRTTLVHTSNRIAMRLLPADVLARVAYETHKAGAEFEVEVARRLADAGGPVGTLDPRVESHVHLRDGFVVTLWTYYECLPSELPPPEYAQALLRLHGTMRHIEIMAPHFTDRVAHARALLDDHTRTPELGEGDRRLLSTTLEQVTASITKRAGHEQLLHGEPHAGNLLPTRTGSRFVDLETCCRGPVEFDIVHAPAGVSEYYPGTDEHLLRQCRILMLAMIITWRWDRDDHLPNGRQRAEEWLTEMRAALADYG
jgi:hypothetical protein